MEINFGKKRNTEELQCLSESISPESLALFNMHPNYGRLLAFPNTDTKGHLN